MISDTEGITLENDPRQKRAFEMNLDPSYWKTKFLYPFALDKAPIRLDGAKQTP